VLEFQAERLAITRKHFARYESISRVLDEHREIVDAVHEDLRKTVKHTGPGPAAGHQCEYTSDTVLRLLISQIVESEDLRGIVIRVDDSNFLRRFTRINDGPMMDSSSLCRFKNTIRPATWKKVNRLLAEAAIGRELIDGDRLRLDTTAYETNVSYPSDSGLLWDVYRVLSRNLEAARELDSSLLAGRRLQVKKVKKQHLLITRKASRKGSRSPDLIPLYKPLVGLAESILALSAEVATSLESAISENKFGMFESIVAESVVLELREYGDLGQRVVDQTRRRVLEGEKVPAKEKLYSIFEPHTELLKRGKAGKPIEFGHMIVIHQVEGCFISGYDVFERRPSDYSLIDPALKNHEELFGALPAELAADRGFHEHPSVTEALEKKIPVVSIAKSGGHRNQRDRERESTLAFKLAQAFRAGVEGSISYLKRALRMSRCLNKGWEHYVSTVGATIFTHNLLVLARSV
jgi:IS5 family transposase